MPGTLHEPLFCGAPQGGWQGRGDDRYRIDMIYRTGVPRHIFHFFSILPLRFTRLTGGVFFRVFVDC
jgi:hypothetical protein